MTERTGSTSTEELLTMALQAHKEYMREEAASVGYRFSEAQRFKKLMEEARTVLRDRGYEVDFFESKLIPIEQRIHQPNPGRHVEVCDEGNV